MIIILLVIMFLTNSGIKAPVDNVLPLDFFTSAKYMTDFTLVHYEIDMCTFVSNLLL